MVTLALKFYRVFFLSIFDNIHRITFLSNFVLRCAQTDVATLNIVGLTSWELLRPFLLRCANKDHG